MTITDAEVEAAARAFDTFAFESWQQSYDYEMAHSGSADEAKGFADWCMGKRIEEVRTNARKALIAASQARALSSGEGDAQVTLDLIREEVSKSNSPLGRSDSLAIDRVRSLLDARPQPPSKDNTNE